MKRSELGFAEGFLTTRGMNNNPQMAFDWDKAAELIKQHLKNHPDLVAEAGLQGDWDYTGGEIFRDGKPTNDDYTYLSSNWATPTLILSWDGCEQEEIDCYKKDSRFYSDSKWDDESLKILGIALEEKEADE